MPDFAQRSFAAGEVSEAVYGRADQVKYQTGLKTCRNMFVSRHGGASNRTGSQFLFEVKDSSYAHRLIRFVYNADQTYVLVFGEQYMRVEYQGALMTVSGLTAWSGATNYIVGSLATSGGGNYYCRVAHINQVPPNATYWYAMPGNVYEIPTPYLRGVLRALYAKQSGDIVNIDHIDYPPYELSRYGHTSWVLALGTFAPGMTRPTDVIVTAGGAGALTYRYKVTAVKQETFEESLTGYGPAKTITGITQANPGVVTSNAHGYENGAEVYLSGIVGMTELNGVTAIVAGVAANTFQLSGINTTAYGAYVSGGIARTTAAIDVTAAAPTSGAPHVVSWTAVAEAQEYNIYKEQDGIFGLIGSAGGTSFRDTNITPDFLYTPPIDRTLFNAVDKYPSGVGYYGQRRFHFAPREKPETLYGSRSGKYRNYTISYPIQDADALTYTVAGLEVNEIRHVVDIGNMIVLTAGGEWIAFGDGSGVLLPDAPGLKQVGYNGATPVPPVIIGNNLLYIQARGNMVRDFRVTMSSDGTTGYSGDDLTVFAPDLFEGRSLVAWAYAQIPHSTVWAVRSDGGLLGLTYIKQHEIAGWHRHDTDGEFEDVVAVPVGDEDLVYVLVKRMINGVTKRYLERFPGRRVSDIERDARFLDSYLTYNGWNTTATTVRLATATAWTYPSDLTLTASASLFVAGDVGKTFVMDVGGEWLDVRVTVYSSGTSVTVRASKDVPVAFQNVATATWGRAVSTVGGLDHLEGKVVGILADGHVVTNGFDLPNTTVVGGVVSAGRPYVVWHVGLPYESDLVTLDLELVNGETIGPKKKQLNALTVQVEGSRGLWAGPTLDQLYERRPALAPVGRAQPVRTEKWEVGLSATWNNSGSYALRQRDPLPLTVLAVYPHGEVGG